MYYGSKSGMAMAYSVPTGVNKILVEKYGYEWVNGKAWRPGAAPESETPIVDVTPGPLPDWITPHQLMLLSPRH